MLDPRTARYLAWWDLVTSLALLFTAFVTPFEVGFLTPPPANRRWMSPLFLCNRAVDCTFIFDMLLQFFVGYVTPRGRNWVFEPSKIRWHYLSSKWFLLDSFSISTSAFDLMGGGAAQSLSGLRALRVLRLIKLVRLARGSRLFKRYELRMSINYANLSLFNVSVMILFACHWFACIWGLQVCLRALPRPRPPWRCPHANVDAVLMQATFHVFNSWMSEKEYCVAWGAVGLDRAQLAQLECPDERVCEEGAFDDTTGLSVEHGQACVFAWPMYSYSVYWSVMTITSVGYGDVAATAFNTAEQVICCLMMLVGGVIWSFLIGTFCGIAANLTPGVAEFRDSLSQLNQLMDSHDLPPLMRFRLREYMHESEHLRAADSYTQIVSRLSPAMQGEMAWTCNKTWLQNIWYLERTEVAMQMDLATRLKAMVFPKCELCPPGVLYIVVRGSAFAGGRVRREGQVRRAEEWVEDAGPSQTANPLMSSG